MRIRWGVIGCGGIAKTKGIPGLVLAENAELVAVQDVKAEVAEEVRAAFGAQYAYATAEELAACPEVDAVYIASPLFVHKEQVLCCAAHGKHVLCEKPLGLNTAEIREMMEACRTAGVKFGVAFMERFHRHHMRAKELIEDGVLGELVSLKAQWSFDYPKGDGIWRQDIRLGGGGGFMDVGTHCIDILRYMSGLEAEEVVALTGNQFYDYTVEDSSQLLARMSNGATMYVSCNYNMSTEPIRFEICGRKGAIFGEGSFSQCGKEAKVYIRMLGEEAKPLTFAGEHNNMYTAEMAAFSEAILQNTCPPVPAEEGLAAQQVVEAAYRSQETGMRVKVEK